MTATTSNEVVVDGSKQKLRRSDGLRTSTCRRVVWTGLNEFDFVVDPVVNVSSSSFKDRRVRETEVNPQRNADTPRNITLFHPNTGNNVGYVGVSENISWDIWKLRVAFIWNRIRLISSFKLASVRGSRKKLVII